MRPTLPQHDADPAKRREALAAQAARYAFHRDHYGALFAAEVARGDFFDVPYGLAAVGAAVAMFHNRARQGHDAWPSVESELRAIAAESPELAVTAAFERLWRTKDYLAAQRPTALSGYADLIASLPRPLSLGRDDDDAFFAWRQLAGMAPVSLRRLDALPDHLALTARDFSRARADGDRLDAALAEGRLFVVDYAALSPLRPGAAEGLTKRVYAPIAVFVTSPAGALCPVAVQLHQRPRADVPLVTPADGLAWRLARVAVNNAEMLFNGLVAHFGRSHLVAEALVCVSRSQLAPAHPLMHLLAPHFNYTTAANKTARTTIVNPGGKQEYLMGGTLESNFEVTLAEIRAERYDRLGLRADLADRGVDDPRTLPEYPYRDDGLALADALRRWSGAYLRAHYPDDEAVRGDLELRAWADALGRDGDLRRVPALETVAALGDFVGDLLWRLTGYHAVVNYAGYDYASLALDTPSALFGDVALAAPSDDVLRAMLPPLRVANGMLEQMYSLRAIQMDRVGDRPLAPPFTDPAGDALKALRRELDEVESATSARDALRRWSFPYLLPSRVPNSVHV